MCSKSFLGRKASHNSPCTEDEEDTTETRANMIPQEAEDRLHHPEMDIEDGGSARNLPGWGTRHTQALIVFMGLSMSFIIRLNLALALVGMENSHRFKVILDPRRKAFAVSSFFVGYSLLQIPAGNLGRKGHAVMLFSCANIFSGVLCILLPYATLTFGPLGIIITRFFTGILQGFVYPNVNNIMSRWAVAEERDSVMCLVHTGNPFGSLLAMAISGYLGHHFDWPSIFYVTGAMGIFFGILMAVTAKDSPDDHKNLSNQERDFIFRSFDEELDEDFSKEVDVPWREIVTSKPVLAMTFCAWCCYWSGWALSLLMPSYINGVLKFEIDDNGILSALPYLLSCFLSIFISIISKYIRKNDLISDRVMRPLWNSIGMLGSGIPIVILAFVPGNVTLAITMITVSACLFVACNVGYMVNHIDLSPRFSGVLMSIMNSVGNIASLLGPFVSTCMLKDETSESDWRNVFLLCGFMFFIGNAVFVGCGTTKKQKWDIGKTHEIVSL